MDNNNNNISITDDDDTNIQLVKSSIGISASSKEDHKDVNVGDRSKLGFLISNSKRKNRGITNDDDDRRLCKSHGSVSLCGRRRVMEDAVTIELGFLSNQILNYDFFGVYGGHGGSKVAQACRNQLHRVLAKEIEVELMVLASESIEKEDYEEEDENLNWEKVMNSCFSKMDKEVIGSDGIEEEGNGSGLMKIIGSTAVVAIIGKGEIVVANCGDSRAVLSRGGIAIPLSRDHKPDRPDEMKRVEDAGGRVIDWNGYRVLGVLGTSRSIGDQYLKPYIISDPEVKVIKRAINDEFLVLASDGLWDVLANETVCQVVRECLEGRPWKRSSSSSSSRNHAYEAAAILAELAMARGSKDNISVVVVELTKPKG